MSEERDIETICDELQRYAECEGTESGEYWQALVDLCGSISIMDEEFQTAWEKEVRENLTWIEENLELVERTTMHTHQYYELVEKGEGSL